MEIQIVGMVSKQLQNTIVDIHDTISTGSPATAFRFFLVIFLQFRRQQQ